MLEPTSQFIEKFIADFSWRRLTVLLGIVLLFVSIFIVYEWQTATSELTRYERTTELLQKLDKLGESNNSEIIKLSKSIIINLHKVIQNKGPNITLEFSVSQKSAQTLYAMLPWLFFILIVIMFAMRGGQDNVSSILLGFGVITMFVGLISYFIPIDSNGWARYGVPQFLNMLILIYFVKKGKKVNT